VLMSSGGHLSDAVTVASLADFKWMPGGRPVAKGIFKGLTDGIKAEEVVEEEQEEEKIDEEEEQEEDEEEERATTANRGAALEEEGEDDE